MSVFVYASSEEYGEVASYLLAIADERGFDRKLIRTTFQGFEVPEGMLLDNEYEPSVPDGVKDVTADAPEWFLKEDRPVDVVQDADGSIYLKEDVAHALAEEFDTTVEDINKQFDLDELESKDDAEEDHEPDREEIREWAKENGYNPAEKGALKKAVIEAYNEAHQP